MKKEKAAISLFLIIILLSTVMFGGLFIDLTRILTAKNKIRTATESAVRSCLADYSEELVSEWGLFAFKADESCENDFKKYLKLNLTTKSPDEEAGAGIINYEIIDDETAVTYDKPLGDKDIFAEKINEYEKYRAPVSLTLGVVEKFKSIFSGNKNAIEELEITGAVEGMKNKMKSTFSNLKNVSGNFNSQVDSAGVNQGTPEQDGMLGDVDVNNFDKLRNNINSDIDSSKNKVREYESSLDEYRTAGDKINDAAGEIISSSSTMDGAMKVEEDDDGFEAGIQTYTTPENTEDNNDSQTKEKMNREREELDSTIDETKDAKEKTEELKVKMNRLIDEAEKCAGEYNDLKDIYNNKKFKNMENALGFLEYSELKKLGIDFKDHVSVKKILTEYDTEEKINSARNYVNKKIKELSDALYEYSKETPNSKSNEEFEAAKNKTTDMSNQKALFNNEFRDKGDDEKKSALKSPKETNDKYSYLKDIFNEFYSKTENSDKSFGDFMNYYDEAAKKADDEYLAINKNRNTISGLESKIGNLKSEMSKVEFEAKYFAANNEQVIIEAVKAKKAAEEKYEEYQGLLDKIKEVNTKMEIGIEDGEGNSKITDFESFSMNNISGSDEEEDKFEAGELFSFAQKIRETIQSLEKTMPSYDSVLEKEIKAEGKNLGMFNKLREYFQQISETLFNEDALKNKFYLVDYVMSKCTYLTSQTSRKHYFDIGEVEYIIYGKESQLENITTAITQVTMLRLAINTLNYFITSVDGELISRAVMAVVRGVTRTVKDMGEMLLDYGGNEKGLIALCPSLSKYKIVSYSDHLRILLLLKLADDGGAGTLRRCIHATMGDEYGDISSVWSSGENGYLGEYYTELNAKAAVDVDLFFIPMFFPEKINLGSLHDGKYKVVCKFTYGY